MSKKIMVSIIMATYNSSKTIELSLKSIQSQNYDPEQIEILVIDGGSTDNTRMIAESYGAKIINNPYRLPEPAKMIGLKNAVGKYILIMDSDEAFHDETILGKRIAVLENSSVLKALQGGVRTPKNVHVGACSNYINEVGDPFTCFIYRTYRGGAMPGVIISRGQYDEKYDCYVAHFGADDIRPIGDSVTLMNREYIVSQYPSMLEEKCTTAAVYDRIIRDVGATAFIKDDYNFHYSSSSFKTYFSKLKFRIINNIFNINESGYSATAVTNKKLNRRKYLFPFYVLTIILPVFDGIRMAIVYKHPVFLLHPIFCIYVIIEIIFQYIKKLCGGTSVNKSYSK